MAKQDGDDLATAVLTLAESLAVSQAQTAAAIDALRQNQAPRDVNFGDSDYQAKLRAETPVLTRAAYQNGFEVDPRGLSQQTIDRLANLAPGKYLGGAIQVEHGQDGAIHLLYKNKTPDQRMANQSKWHDFTDMVEKIWAEMSAPVAKA